ncbi:uncharacterized protein C8Q71DRAFT_249575 [Rhodofomes roseus]|uniref:Uncharacterized protein n=1 Tax=Rhodofomes roseus TaxID=34475 RepID=A0ABQ8K708_9APHY|nr:uncharacterized protein C8Q71DRAFT_249575 [Rhodofomes roseus]KAH9833037.1 hypothetical protein C8Q71DRAFT_249575 [Rhodofomes roseus]
MCQRTARGDVIHLVSMSYSILRSGSASYGAVFWYLTCPRSRRDWYSSRARDAGDVAFSTARPVCIRGRRFSSFGLLCQPNGAGEVEPVSPHPQAVVATSWYMRTKHCFYHLTYDMSSPPLRSLSSVASLSAHWLRLAAAVVHTTSRVPIPLPFVPRQILLHLTTPPWKSAIHCCSLPKALTQYNGTVTKAVYSIRSACIHNMQSTYTFEPQGFKPRPSAL